MEERNIWCSLSLGILARQQCRMFGYSECQTVLGKSTPSRLSAARGVFCLEFVPLFFSTSLKTFHLFYRLTDNRHVASSGRPPGTALKKRSIQRLSESAKILINSLCRRLILFTSGCPSTSLQSFAVSSSFSTISAHFSDSSNVQEEIRVL